MNTDREILRQIAVLTATQLGSVPAAPEWKHGDADFSPADDLDRVTLKYVETVLIPKYGESIDVVRRTISGGESAEVVKRVPIPRLFYIPEAARTEFALWQVGNSAIRQPQNAAWTWKMDEKGRVEADHIMAVTAEDGDLYPTTLATNEPLPIFLQRLEARLQQMVDGHAFGVLQLTSDSTLLPV